MTVTKRILVAYAALALSAGMLVSPASATPVCTDGYMGGPPVRRRVATGSFPKRPSLAAYVQYLPDPAGFRGIPARDRVPRREVPPLDLGLQLWRSISRRRSRPRRR